MAKRNPQPFDDHHRKPQSKGGTNKSSNISRVRRDKHVAYHKLFGNGSPHDVARILNSIWIDPDFMLVVVEKNPVKPDKLKFNVKRPTGK